MNKDDKFIKEKLDLVTKIDNDDLEVPDVLRDRYSGLTASLSAPKKAKDKKIKTGLIATITSCTAAIITIVLLCTFLIPKQNDDSFYYYDEDLKSYIVSYDEMIAGYDFFYPEMDYYAAGFNVNKDIETQVAVFATMDFALADGDLEMTIVFVDNYTFVQSELYDRQVTEPGTTGIFAYKYKIFSEGNTSLAKCEYKGYKYFLRYTSDYPEDITDIMASLVMK